MTFNMIAKSKLSILSLAVCLMFTLALPSCTEEGKGIFTPFNEPSDSFIEDVPTGKDKNKESFQSVPNAPSGWSTPVIGLNGTALYRKGSENTFVVRADLKAGAKVQQVYTTPTNQGNTHAKFTRRSLSTWNTYGTFFAIANSMYFDRSQSPAELPFPFKQGGVIESYGTGGSNEDRLKQKGVLNIYSNYADIISISVNPMIYAPLHAANHSYAGFLGNVGNDVGSSVGRTLVGLKDEDGNGTLEVVYLLVCASKNQTVAFNILTQEFGCTKVITFDGGGSSQLICKGTTRVASSDSRTIPVCIAIKEN